MKENTLFFIFIYMFNFSEFCFCKENSLISITDKKASMNLKADKILIEKGDRQLSLFYKGNPFKVYKIALGKNPLGPKVKRGDGKTPEGIYKIDYRNPKSRFHLSLHISYPNASDIKRAKKLGVSPGGDIMIHGIGKEFGYLGKSHSLVDWTLGCIAVTNEEIEEIWKSVQDGIEVEIRP